jgi:hypothetical protein
VIKERKGVSVGTLSSWVREFGEACMSPIEISDAFRFRTHNRWSGILLLDGKYLNKRQMLLLAIDYVTLDIVAWSVCEAETGGNYVALVDVVLACGYTIKALVSDGHPALFFLTQPPKQIYERKGTRGYPRPGIVPAVPKIPRLIGVIHQWCVVHAERELKQFTAKLPKEERELFNGLIHQILFADTLSRAQKYHKKLLEITALQSGLYLSISTWISLRWKFLMAHHTERAGRRKIPRSSNTAENVISYVNVRLKTMRRLRTPTSSQAITNLIVVNYRTKPLSNSGNKLKRGKSPLELVSGKKGKLDWIQFIKNHALK